MYIRQAWVAFKAYNESLAVATQDADEATRVLMEAANHSTLMVDPCQCPQIPTTPCEEGSDDNESNKKGTCAAPAFMRADLDSAARDPENSCTCQAPDVSIRGDADAAVTSPPPECGFDVEILGSDPGFTAAVYRGVAILRKVVLRAPSALADPDCWWAIASAAWNGDSSPPDIEPSASDNGAGNAALLSWIPAWAQPWAHQAESLLHQQTVPGKKGHPTGAGALKSLAAYLPSTGHLAAWSETVVAHGSAIAAGFAASAGVAFARLAAAGAVFIDAAISALLFVNILFYLLSAPKPWLQVRSEPANIFHDESCMLCAPVIQLMLEAILSTEGAASTLELLTGNVSTLLAVNAQVCVGTAAVHSRLVSLSLLNSL